MHTRHPLLLPVFVAFALGLLVAPREVRDSPGAFHASFGRGPTIVLVHGLGSRSSHWLATARRLARDHRVVLVDLPGHGASAMPEPLTLERATTSLDQALAALGREPVVLVGHSVGGLVAAAEAIAHPERVRGLVLVETALAPQIDGTAREDLLTALDYDYRTVLRTAYTAFGRDSVQGAALYAEVAALDSNVIKPWVRLAVTADLSSEAARLQAPVLAVLAEHSWPIDEPWERTAAELGYSAIPRCEPLRLGECGHFVMLDRPEPLAAAIARFAANTERKLMASF